MKKKQQGPKANAPKKEQKNDVQAAIRAIERGRKVAAETGEWQIGLLPKKSISIRIEPAIIDWFKSRGGNYQTLMRRVLKQYAADDAEHGILRKVRPRA